MNRAALVFGVLAGALWLLPLALQTCAGPWLASELANRNRRAACIAETMRDPGPDR